MNARADRFPLFDSLRGIAAVFVLLAHTAALTGSLDADSPLRPYMARFEVAFTIFFIVSAFLLYRPFVRARLRGEPPLSTAAYGWRRLLRILPAYWVALAFLAWWFDLAEVFTPEGLLTYFGFAQLYRESTVGGGIPQAWTLCVEVVFYAFLPLYAALMRRLPARTARARLRQEIAVPAGLVLFSLAWNAAWVYSGTIDRISYEPVPVLSAMPGYLDHLALGMLLAVATVWLEDRPLPRALRVLDRWPSLAWALAALGFWFAATRIGLENQPAQDYTPGQYMARHVLNSLVALAIVAPAIVGDPSRGVVRRVLANRGLLYLGVISYGFYLYHYAVISTLAIAGFGEVDLGPEFLKWVVVSFAGSVVVGSLSYHLVERPALGLKDVVPARRPMPQGEAVAESAPLAPASPRAG